MPENTEKTRLTDRKRSSILAAAVDEFQQNGFDGTSMDRIAATADVSKRTVYNHFCSKDDLFASIVEELTQRCQLMECQYSSIEPLDGQLLVIAKNYAARLTNEDYMKLCRVVISRFIQSPELAGSIRDRSEYQSAIIDWITAAKDDGRLTVESPVCAATQFTSLIKAFAFWPQIIGNDALPTKRELNRIIKSAVAMFMAHYATEV